MSLSGDNVPFWGQRPFLGTMSPTGDNVPFWGQCSLLLTLGLALRHFTKLHIIFHIIEHDFM